ncbi:hypothetical protein MHEL_47780 [Mycolicibacterium helvum]|uniref:Uncharacterized protein n=1 Tax=Mycolicibacterium helvum TaxID=1534349 RepID=A0A7I7TDV7_9MYCO|nr:hypothetical protein MHEL_47780 [Mycolicibacterium helvum]
MAGTSLTAAAVPSAASSLSALGGSGALVIPSPAAFVDLLAGARRDFEHMQTSFAQSFSALANNPVGAATAGLTALRAAIVNVEPRASDTPSPGFQLYTIYNLTSAPMTLVNVNIVTPEGAGRSIVRTPPVGTVIDPGGKMTFELAQKRTSILGLFTTTAFRDTDVVLTFKDAVGASVNVRAEYTYWQARPVTGGGGLAICDSARCKVEGDDGDSRRTVFLLGDGDSAIDASTLPIARQQKLVGLCGASQVTCKWADSKVQQGVYGQAEVLGAVVTNNTSVSTTTVVTVTIQKAYSSTIKGAVKGGFDLFSVVKAEVSAEYTRQWTDTYTFSQQVTVPLRANYMGWVEGTVPVDVVTGTLIVQTPGQTIYLRNIKVEVPIAGGQPRLSIQDRALPNTVSV